MMFLQSVVLSYFLCMVSSVLSKPDSKYTIYDEYISEVIKFEEIKRKIKNSFFDTDEGTLTALKMFDASTKIPNGLSAGNAFDLGNFDECYGIKYENIYGKYCLGTLKVSFETEKYFKTLTLNKTSTQMRHIFGIQLEPRLAALGAGYEGLHFAACVPSNWSASDIPGLLEYTEEFCYSKATEPPLSTGAIVTIVVLSIFLAIIVACTVFDVYLYYSEKEPPHELLIAFSILSNGRKIFKSSTNADQLLCLNGIKAISMMWVIIGHEYSLLLNAPLTNFLDITDWQHNPVNMWIMGATVSVDTFLVVGGLVTVYVFLKSMDNHVKFNVILYYIHRYLRLTPALAIVALINLYLVTYLSNGPLWKTVDLTLVKTCEEGWWTNFLYITNYVQTGTCVPQAWYLCVDMQLFVLSPLLLVPLTKWPKITLGVLGALSVAGCVVPFAISYAENIGSLFSDKSGLFLTEYYMQTYTRFGPYVMGMIVGYFTYQVKKSELSIRFSPMTVFALWFICLTGLTACVYAGYPLNVATEDDRWGNAFFLGFNRPAWALALCGVIFLCVCGYGGPVDKFLSLPIFQFVTKVSYSMYLVHYTIITVRIASMKNTMKFSNIGQMHIFWGDFMFTLFIALVLCLSFESPIIILEKCLFRRNLSKSTPSNKKPAV